MASTDFDLVVDGVSLVSKFGGFFTSDFELGTPDPKTYTVDIPGGNGVIDLTDALAGDVAYEQREQTFHYVVDLDGFETVKRRLMGWLHGQRKSYTLAFDPGYTYTGRFTVGAAEYIGWGDHGAGRFELKITADPYKSRGTQAYKLNATGGKLYRFESGRRKVRPTIECEQPCFVTWNGEETIVPAGTYRLNDVVFSQGFNELWVNTKRFFDITWDEIAEGGQFASTWGDLDGMRWDEIHMLGQSTEDVVRSWDDLALTRWSDLAEKHWYDLNYIKNVVGDSTAYLTYEWEDL